MYYTDKGNQSWIVFGKTDVKPEAPILWPPDAESRLIGKNLDAEKDWRQRRKGWQRMRWYHLMDGDYHWLNGHEFEKILGHSEGHDAVYGLQRVRHDLATEQQCIK